MSTRSTPEIGEVYGLLDQREQAWFLVQVVEKERSQVAFLTLDFLSHTLPTVDDLSDLKPLRRQAYSWGGEVEAYFVQCRRVPKNYRLLGRVEPLLADKVNTYGAFWPTESTKARELRWDQLPSSVKTQYQECRTSTATAEVDGKSHRLSTWRLQVGEDGSADLSQLTPFGALTCLQIVGRAPGLASYLAENPLVTTVELVEHGESNLDFSEAQLETLTVELGSLRRLVLNSKLRELKFQGDLKQLTQVEIVHPQGGKWLTVSFTVRKGETPPALTLPELQGLELEVEELDLKPLIQPYPNLEFLTLWGSPGYLTNFAALQELKKLQHLQIKDVFGYPPEDLPSHEDLPELDSLWLTSIPKDVGKVAKKRFKSLAVCDVTQLRDSKWLSQNLNNPFRDWDGREGIPSGLAKKALKAYKTLHGGLSKSIDNQTELILKFVETFNEIESKSRCVSTLEREEVAEALESVIAEFDLERLSILELFDEVRDF